jgi:hypothetical protein
MPPVFTVIKVRSVCKQSRLFFPRCACQWQGAASGRFRGLSWTGAEERPLVKLVPKFRSILSLFFKIYIIYLFYVYLNIWIYSKYI